MKKAEQITMLTAREVALVLDIGVPTVTYHCRNAWKELTVFGVKVQKIGRDWFIPAGLLLLPQVLKREAGRPRKEKANGKSA